VVDAERVVARGVVNAVLRDAERMQQDGSNFKAVVKNRKSRQWDMV
jgi:hypothetical protein